MLAAERLLHQPGAEADQPAADDVERQCTQDLQADFSQFVL